MQKIWLGMSVLTRVNVTMLWGCDKGGEVFHWPSSAGRWGAEVWHRHGMAQSWVLTDGVRPDLNSSKQHVMQTVTHRWGLI